MSKELKKILNVIKEKTDYNQLQIAEVLGVNPRVLSDLVNGRKSDAYVKRVCEQLKEKFNIEDNSTPQDGNPYFNEFTIQGGGGHGTGMEQALAPDGYMAVPGVPTKQDIMFFKVRGNSMLNKKDPSMSIPHGAWVALKKAQSQMLRWGEVYAFETVDGPIIKKVEQSDIEGCIRCVSFNEEESKPFDVAYTDIVEGTFHRVLGIVNVNMWSY